MIYSCLKLHGQLCPQEMLVFHGTLEKFFNKNFAEEIKRLSMDSSPEPRVVDAMPSSARLPTSVTLPSPSYPALFVTHLPSKTSHTNFFTVEHNPSALVQYMLA